MKSKSTKVTKTNACHGLLDLRSNRINSLHTIRTQVRVGSGQHSIQNYIERLKGMVPNIRMGEKLDVLEILQRVIEYIQYLEDALEIRVTPAHVVCSRE